MKILAASVLATSFMSVAIADDRSISKGLDEIIKEQPSYRQPNNPWKFVVNNFAWKFKGYSNRELSEDGYSTNDSRRAALSGSGRDNINEDFQFR